jgi:transcriptional regulator with XRE-family HTH domain
MNRDAAIGRQIALLREQANLKQHELAKRLEWSAAVLSRVEKGERVLSEDELEIVVTGIGTDDAAKFKERLARRWIALPEPDLGDPDLDLLWEAERVAQDVRALSENPDVKQIFERRLTRYMEEIRSAAQRVTNKRYSAMFAGTIAVGKSTAICRAEGLELPSTRGMPKAVLETGAGGVTICEVHVRQGPGYGLIVEPCSEDEVRRQVTEFAKVLLGPGNPSADASDAEAGLPGISREVERALRNMSGLKKRRSERKPDGTVVPASDEARALASSAADVKALSVEILAKMELHKRDRRDLWYSDTSGIPPLEWVQDLFEKINNGRHSEFTLPRRIELVVPTPILGQTALSITLIDTQGIDDLAERADLEQHFDDSFTVTILCTVFNEAPSTAVRRLLVRAKEAGVRTLPNQCAILVLPRPGEALEVKDHEGYRAQGAQDGYDLKGDEVRLKLQQLSLADIPLLFFNAAEDAPSSLRSFLTDRIESVRRFHRDTLKQIIGEAAALLGNYEEEQAREVMRAAARRLTTWLNNNAELLEQPAGRVHDSLTAAVDIAHPRTVYAAIIRDGNWQYLSYAHQLSHGSRRVAAQLTEPKLNDFEAIAQNLLQDEELEAAHDLVRQCVRLLEEGFDDLLQKAQLVGQSVHADELSADVEFWRACYDEWGRGIGYRDRINGHNRNWFERQHDGEADARVAEIIRTGWTESIRSVSELLRPD